MTHKLKIWPKYFNLTAEGKKPWELRFNDRDYRADDDLELHEYLLDEEHYTGRVITADVPYAYYVGEQVIMSLENIQLQAEQLQGYSFEIGV